MTLFDHFGLLAPIYDRVIQAPAAERLRLLASLDIDDRLLDVGGGTGRVSEFLKGFVRTTCVLDVSSGMLRQAAAKSGLVPCRGVAEALPFADGAFTKMVAVDTFHHFGDQVAAAGEMLRVLAPGGCLVVEEPDIRRFPVKLVAVAERVALMRSHFHPPAVLVGLFSLPTTRVRVFEEAPNFWVVVNKLG